MPTVLDTSGLAGVATNLASVIATALSEAGRPVDTAGIDLPIPAAPVGDACSQVSVCVEGLARHDSFAPTLQGINTQGHWATSGYARFLVGFSVTVVRCVESDPNVGGLPNHDDAVALTSDLWLIANLLKQGHQTGALFDADNEWFFDGAVAVHNQGGYAGFQLVFRLSVDALPTPLVS